MHNLGILCLVIFGFFGFALAEPKVPGKLVYNGDMIEFIPDNPPRIGPEGTRAGINSVIDQAGNNYWMKWPNNRIPYKWDNTVTPKGKANILQGVQDIMTVVPNCWKFVEAEGDEYHVLFSQKEPGKCYAYFGNSAIYGGKNQVANFGEACNAGTIVHELLHTVGFRHEQTRDDRDDYVWVYWQNIGNDPFWQAQYYKDGDWIIGQNGAIVKTPYNTTYYGIPYNFDSIMHYPYWSPANPNLMAMQAKGNPNAWGNPRNAGQTSFLSTGDILMIARHGGCPVSNNPQAFRITGASAGDIFDPTLSDARVDTKKKQGIEMSLNFEFKN